MGQIVLGIGTSHSPLLTMEPSLWGERAKDDLLRKEICLADGRTLSYPALEAETGGRYVDEACDENHIRSWEAANNAMARIVAEIEAADPDLLIIIGDDQDELFSRSQMPMVAVYSGSDIAMHPRNLVSASLPQWLRSANVGYGMDVATSYPGAPDAALDVARHLTEAGIDITFVRDVPDPRRAGFGHAFGFILESLCRRPIPTIPLLVNCFFPPNVPTAQRAFAIGKALAGAVESLPESLRVAVIASGGLSHFHVDEPLDRAFLHALRTGDEGCLSAIPATALRSGNSELLNWIVAAGALSGHNLTWDAYLPVRRTPAGTGIGLAFAVWK